MDRLVLAEANAVVTAKEGTRMTAARAVMRARLSVAAEGDSLAMKDFDDRPSHAEETMERARRLAFETALAVQDYGERFCAWEKRTGRKTPEFFIHPDDIVLDHSDLSCRIEGPISATENRHYEELLTDMAYLRRLILKLKKRLERDPGATGDGGLTSAGAQLPQPPCRGILQAPDGGVVPADSACFIGPPRLETRRQPMPAKSRSVKISKSVWRSSPRSVAVASAIAARQLRAFATSGMEMALMSRT